MLFSLLNIYKLVV